ncbi:zf-HC2 domain-containing protein [Cryobacterium lactosi]|uniref:Zf-HC2 domain-containing protein n=1 Tax=Cryobacterium lactosi TaxID=1259202 RepID=A0A4R9BNR9_9MICO|nr:zf-HC2 domain-containing protein [Cryobacterium lactosi]TFD88101.1 zf-HC2 domain-containing protein [Cryobacterium lactosi]
MTSTPDSFRDWDAAYVLGALSAEDRRDFERHLPTCPACAAAVAELAGLPGILAVLPAADAAALTEAPADPSGSALPDGSVPGNTADEHLRAAMHQPQLLRRLAGAAARRTRRTRIHLALAGTAAAAVLLLGGGLLGAALTAPSTLQAGPAASAPPASTPTDSAPTDSTPTDSTPTATRVVAMEPVQAGALTADLSITDTDWGTRFDWSCVYLNELWKDNGPQDYDMVMTDLAGTATVLATWTATSPSTENLAASTELPLDQIRSVEIRASSSGTPLAHSDL